MKNKLISLGFFLIDFSEKYGIISDNQNKPRRISMAYVSKDLKAKVAGLLKTEFPGTAKDRGFKYSLAVRHHSTLVITISEGTIDFIGNFIETTKNMEGRDNSEIPTYINVNTYNMNNWFSGDVRDILTKIRNIMNTGNHDNSDIMTDYFDIGWYVDINIGKWDKPYKLL
jgi:hypothetical protein